LKIVGLVNCDPNGDRAFVVPVNFMFFYGGAIGSSTVFGRDRGREVPFYIAGTADEGDIVQMDNLGMLDCLMVGQLGELTLRTSSNFGCRLYQYLIVVICGARSRRGTYPSSLRYYNVGEHG
jgi:hypothetical protein